MESSYLHMPLLYRSAVTQDEFQHNLKVWTSTFNGDKNYPILYLGYHGTEEKIVLGEHEFFGRSEISIEQLAEALAGKCKDRVVHFGSCSTLSADDELIEYFLDQTECSAISGYSGDVEWAEAMAFDVLYIKLMQYGGGKALTPVVMRSIRNGNAKRWGLCEEDNGFGRSPYYDWAQYLGFRIELSN